MRGLILAAVTTLQLSTAQAATQSEVEQLTEALGLGELVDIMRDEGLDYAEDIEAQLFPGKGGDAWEEIVSAIYDPEVMREDVIGVMAEDLTQTDLTPLHDFFVSERGTEIIAYEISAREALMDEDIEEAAKARLANMRAEESPELVRIDRFVEVNDLIESNVMGAMNSNYAFYQGLSEGGAFDGTMTESDILADVWAQEDTIRADTDIWVYAYLAMAYQPLSNEDFDAYIAISETPEGRALNRALFEGFDAMYSKISRALGVAAASFMAGEEI